MKALIYNSGIGKRLGEWTLHHPKCLIQLKNGESVLHRQLRVLRQCGITEFLITTGPFKEQIEEVATDFKDCHFTFVHNDRYEDTNYIYSLYLCREHLDDDLLCLHGDLVFDRGLVEHLLEIPAESVCLYNPDLPQPPKDFKGRIVNGYLKEVSVNIFDEDCYAFQPLYKLSKETMGKWYENVCRFVESGNDRVYAENAFNEKSDEILITAASYQGHYINEIDNLEDLENVSRDIEQYEREHVDLKLPKQLYFSTNEMGFFFRQHHSRKVLVVCDRFLENGFVMETMRKLGLELTVFSGFKPNPLYEDVQTGIKLFKEKGCDTIVALGGGSAIDTAKCIKLYAPLDENEVYMQQELKPVDTPFMAIPSTCGTGSEATRYAVIYYQGAKQSITSEMIIPDCVILESRLIETVPPYQRRATMLDSLSQGIESFWCVNSNEDSRKYATKTIELVLNNWQGYLNNEEECNRRMQLASYYSGQAINITQTTAGHAMSYKISSLYNVSHGHAVAICLQGIWRYMKEGNIEVIDARGDDYYHKMMKDLDVLSGSLANYEKIFKALKMPQVKGRKEDLETLCSSVVPVRLKNHPVRLNEETIEKIYREVLDIND